MALICSATERDHWMSFAFWYSCQKNLPDANVVLVCEPTVPNKDVFRWAYRLKVPIWRHERHIPIDFLKLSPHVMAVREYLPDSVGPVDCKTEEVATFVSYQSGVGCFVLSEWIDRHGVPFGKAERFHADDITVNESKILKLWERSDPLYSMT